MNVDACSFLFEMFCYCICIIIHVIYNHSQYTSLVNLCNDILGTVCAPDRIQSMLSAAKEIPSGGTIMQQVISWTNAVSVAVSRLKNGFGEYLDVVEPFVMALHQVHIVLSNKIAYVCFDSCRLC